jgi:hypothetical protein
MLSALGSFLGKAAGFLGSAGTAASGFGSIMSAFQGNPDLTKWKYRHRIEDQEDYFLDRKIAREGAYMTGMAPYEGQYMETMAAHEARAYNHMQDETYARDTARAKERMHQLFPNLNEWELAGANQASAGNAGATPAAPQKQTPRTDPAVLNAQVQMGIAKLQADTALKTTAMQTGASLGQLGVGVRANELREAEVEVKQFDNWTKRMLADNDYIKAQAATSQAEAGHRSVSVQEERTMIEWDKLSVSQREEATKRMVALYQTLPEQVQDLVFMKTKEHVGWDAVATTLLSIGQPDGPTPAQVKKAINTDVAESMYSDTTALVMQAVKYGSIGAALKFMANPFGRKKKPKPEPKVRTRTYRDGKGDFTEVVR